MLILDQLAEQRIQEAMDRGEFNDLPGAGRPQELEDDSMVPEHLRVAYRVLKNAGFLPPEVQARRDIERVEDLIEALADAPPEQQRQAQRRLHALRSQVNAYRESRGGHPLWADPTYQDRLLDRLQRAARDEAE